MNRILINLVLTVFLIENSNAQITDSNWKNLVPNYGFENVTTDYPRNDHNLINIIRCNDDDTTRYLKKENTKHSLNFQLLGPAYLSSLGYSWENQLSNKIALQMDFRLAGQIEYISSGWDIGPSMNQSILLFGNNPRLKLGFTEGIVFNIPSIRGVFQERSPWDRPPRIMYFFSTNIGCEFNVFRNVFYITPELNFFNLNAIKDGVSSNMVEIPVKESIYFISFGIDLKLRL